MNPDVFREQLNKQLHFLETSCREYDAGNLDEAVQIATSLRVMFHTTASSTSLLTHLGAAGLQMVYTAGKRVAEHSLGYWPGIIDIDIDVGNVLIAAQPTLDSKPWAHPKLPFNAWWDGDVIYAAATRRLKRRALVLAAANKDGGAHVDATMPPDYQFFLDGADFAFGVQRPNGTAKEARLVDAHLACQRQVAHEVFRSEDLLRLARR